MASFFRASCFIFWLVWLLSFSFLLGTLNFYETHIVPDDAMEMNMLLLRISCFVNIFYAFFGCVFMKCDINHIICAFLYILPLGLIIPGISIWGVINTIGDHEGAIPDEKAMIDVFKNYYMAHKEFPNWLTLAEDELECCGIKGPQDYREFFRSESFPMTDCLENTYDIPCSCCRIRDFVGRIRYLDWSKTSDMRSPYTCVKFSEAKRCQDETGSKEWTKNIFTTSKHTDRMMFSIQQKCDKKETEPFELDKVLFNKTLYINGCHSHLGGIYSDMRAWLLIFFGILTGCPLMMLIVYLRSFCRSKPLSRHKSEHSLDIETVSVLDSPVGFTSGRTSS